MEPVDELSLLKAKLCESQMSCNLELEQKKEEINGIALQVYHESSSQQVNGHNTILSKVALK